MSREWQIENIAVVLVQDIHINKNLADILATALVDKIKVGTKDRFYIQYRELLDGLDHIKALDYNKEKV